MKEIRDTALLERYLQKYRIRELFDTPELPFRLVEYARGDRMNLLHPPEDFLKFVVEGTVCIYSISGEGNRYMHGRIDRPAMLGEVEFCGGRLEGHWHEASTVCRCIELYVEPLRETLWRDNRFLRLMLRTFANARVHSDRIGQAREVPCRERLLTYLQYTSDHTLTAVEATAERLHCSPRQLLRELKALTESGQVEKLGRGTYRLKKI